MADFHGLFELEEKIHVTDIGAAAIAEKPIYMSLIEAEAAYLSAFDGDQRQTDGIKAAYGDQVRHFEGFIFDGTIQTAYFTSPESGMSSLLKPNPNALNFFNGFPHFGTVLKEKQVETTALDSLDELSSIDFLKMDVQGAELRILQCGKSKLNACLSVQLEVPFICLYEDQPTFGEIDTWLRNQGFAPHCFLEVKRWSIAPTVFRGDFRAAGNQLLEADIVYVKDPLDIDSFSDLQLKKLVFIADMSLHSVDLCVRLVRELVSRNTLPSGSAERYLQSRMKPAPQ
jgi:FkbM family methyltransferase